MTKVKVLLVSVLLTFGYLGVAAIPNCITKPKDVVVSEGETAQLKVSCDASVDPAVEVPVFCIAGSATPGTDTDSVTYTMQISGTSGSVDMKTVADADCNEGDETLTCFMGSVDTVHLSGQWSITIKECPCGQSAQAGPVKTCENPEGSGGGGGGGGECLPSCPAGQTYSTYMKKCYATCPCKTGYASGDPHYTTFDGVRYDFFPRGTFVVAEDCKDRTWSVCHVTSRQCAGGRIPTCADETVIRVQRLKTTLRYNRFKNAFWFEGEKPAREDMAVTLSGRFFTAYLPKEGITVKQYVYNLQVTVCTKWFGKVCGLFGTPDNNRANEFSLRDGTVVNVRDPRFIADFNCVPLPPPPPPPPPPCPKGKEQKKAMSFCKVLINKKGSYAKCHKTIPPGKGYKEPVDTPYEQCVYDHCVVGESTACSDILQYGDDCQAAGIKVGDPPRVCKPTCPPDKIFNKCGPLVPPSCDAPKGKKGCAVGCYCPEGKYLSRCGACVDVCQEPVHFDKNNYYVEEKLGSFCVKLLRTGKLTTELPTTVDLSEQLSADASGTATPCCGCKGTPVMCGGSKKCTVTFAAGEAEKCMRVKFDPDYDSEEDKKITMSTIDDKVTVKIKNSPNGNCLKFSLFRYRIWSINQYTNIALAKPAAEDICTTITTIDGSADGCLDYQGGKYKACFKKGFTGAKALIPAVLPRRTGQRCYSQKIEACEGGKSIPMCTNKYAITFGLTLYMKNTVYLCHNRPATAATICSEANTEVVLATFLEDAQPEECFFGYTVEIYKVFKGKLKAGQKKKLLALPVWGCPDPNFPYGRNYLVAGYLKDDKLVVEKTAYILNCPTFTPLLPQLCPKA